MDEQAQQIQRTVADFRSRNPRAAYPREIREQVVEYARRGRAQGRSWRELAEAVGMGTASLHHWVNDNGKAKGQATLVPVAVSADQGRKQSDRSVVVISPSGFRLEGLSFTEAADLLRMLS